MSNLQLLASVYSVQTGFPELRHSEHTSHHMDSAKISCRRRARRRTCKSRTKKYQLICIIKSWRLQTRCNEVWKFEFPFDVNPTLHGAQTHTSVPFVTVSGIFFYQSHKVTLLARKQLTFDPKSTSSSTLQIWGEVFPFHCCYTACVWVICLVHIAQLSAQWLFRLKLWNKGFHVDKPLPLALALSAIKYSSLRLVETEQTAREPWVSSVHYRHKVSNQRVVGILAVGNNFTPPSPSGTTPLAVSWEDTHQRCTKQKPLSMGEGWRSLNFGTV